MKVIAESGSTRTEWALVDGDKTVEHAFTQGLNPYFQSRRDLSHIIRLEMPEVFFRRRWDHIHFYGAGCTNLEKKKIVEASLVAQFKTLVTVESDLLAAARGLFVKDRGIACILGTGSNSCLYDGENIIKNVRPAGFILGDEGSAATLGKLFLSDCLKNLAPRQLTEEFYSTFSVNPDMLMDVVYTGSMPNRALSSYSFFLANHQGIEYVDELIYRNIKSFFERNIIQYDYQTEQIAFVGKVANVFPKVLKKVAKEYGLKIRKIAPNSLPGLIEYHSNE